MKMRRSKFVAGSMIFAAGSLTLQSSQADIYISQYYEGASNNKWIEIYNSGESAVDLGAGGFRYGIWNNSPANIGWKTSTTANGSFSISATISAGGVLTLANSSSALPFAASRANIANGTVNFNGDDSVVIYTGTPYAFANVVDAFGMTATSTTGSPGTDQSWSRKTSVTTGVNTDFSSASWDGFSNAAVDGAAVTTDERIGVYKRGGISVVWDVNGTTALTGGTGIWNVSSTFFTSKAGGSGTAGDYYAYNESTNRRDNVILGGTAYGTSHPPFLRQKRAVRAPRVITTRITNQPTGAITLSSGARRVWSRFPVIARPADWFLRQPDTRLPEATRFSLTEQGISTSWARLQPQRSAAKSGRLPG